jgi:hypothetical protein
MADLFDGGGAQQAAAEPERSMARTRAWSHRLASSARRAVNPLLNVGVPGTVLLIPGQDILAFLLEDPMKRKLLYITLLFIAFMLITTIFVIREPFENQEEDPAADLQQIMTFFSETLCPVYKVIVDDIKTQKEGSESEKNTAADLEIQKGAGGTVFPCPPPADPIQISADMDLKIQRTVFFFEKRLVEMKTQITSAMGTCQGFEDMATRVCAPPLGQSKSPPPPPATEKDCKPVHALTEQDRLPILKARYDMLTRVAQDKTVLEGLAKVKALSTELLELKRKAEAGELSSSCPT